MAWANASFEVVLDDLSSRFIINVPDEELASVERICFQIEQAHWFYEDFVREQNTSLPSFSLKNFSAKFFQHCPLLHEWANEHETAFANFMEYKIRVPVCGAIILNENLDKCILVKGWSARSGWGFPKGKINKDELDAACAVREVWEETGFDATDRIRDQDYVEQTIKDQRIRLYIIKGVPENTVFEPQTRKEISKIEWHNLTDLPTYKPKPAERGSYSGKESGSERGPNNLKNPSRYYMVIPFVQKLKNWIATQKRNGKRKGPVQSGQQSSLSAGATTEAPLDSDILKSMLGIGKALPELSPPQTTIQSPPLRDAQQTTDSLRAMLGIQAAAPAANPHEVSSSPALQSSQIPGRPVNHGSDALKAMLGISSAPAPSHPFDQGAQGSPVFSNSSVSHGMHRPDHSPMMSNHYPSPSMPMIPRTGSPAGTFGNGRKNSMDLLALLNSGGSGGGGGGGGGGSSGGINHNSGYNGHQYNNNMHHGHHPVQGGSPMMHRQDQWNIHGAHAGFEVRRSSSQDHGLRMNAPVHSNGAGVVHGQRMTHPRQ